ncbi:MAG: hypothetical protein MUP21_05225 [Dehalococcoidia bacterium]|nr:hypothetical protein [Dehalococcoidia bacterium]
MRTRLQLTEKMRDEENKMKKTLDDLMGAVLETGPTFRLGFTFFLKGLATVDVLIRLALLRHLTARSLSQFGQDHLQLTANIAAYLLLVLMLAITAVIYLLTLVIVRPLEFLLKRLKK